MTDLHSTVEKVTARVIERSRETRKAYLDLIQYEREKGVDRPNLSCSNLAHGFAAMNGDKPALRDFNRMNIGVVTSYNDMLSAHEPYYRYPEQMKVFAREVGATVQVAGGVPAMCDGVTQGQPGMEESLFSRDVIALATSVSLSHGMFEGAALLGICDKIVPGLLMGALRFGHLPTILVPSGPMTTGIPNKEKIRIRQLYAQGKIGQKELLDMEAACYHAEGTCTFYGTANTNQMVMEVLGLHMPGSAFVTPGTPLRQALTRAAVHRVAELGWKGDDYRPLGKIIDEKSIVNAIVGLLATGGSTNHTMHIPAIARAAGVIVNWNDFHDLSEVVPLIARIYPNGPRDINEFQNAGGMAYVIKELLSANLLNRDVTTIAKGGIEEYAKAPALNDAGELVWKPAGEPGDDTILRPVSNPFAKDGGLRLLEGNLGRAMYKASAVDPKFWTIEAPVRVFSDQDDVQKAFKAGELNKDVIVVVRFQGPRANGMPELHKLTPALGVLQDNGYKVALVTDGRMSGATGKVPVALHVSPEALGGGAIGKLRDGDIVRISVEEGKLEALVPADEWNARPHAEKPAFRPGTGRELFDIFRQNAAKAEDGAVAIYAGAGI
ncbi:6-phosphogluconate dehydratase [Zymomonas mobilis subsp. mobilis ZM4 = ATCC 31821]|uniref:Phosphogluconate dehydratase n=2 Tax=Zymomonas mobilis subsp. mobilis TaxID=120045 RepID=EDD_ZYMMO|nr:phosphogluconate dehydratase [Zymomonas mobilis]P21909.2 RecName: Full=Phosphogluconate dehydratase; AltName: Full=6-phosphogluconate dehydratase [Zymomonas mobilis subsp. mobilis ZM4 = ATCC 31821]AAV88992.1 6-phosphogluconate dehydratase [Zymomonas mobilis subsp. mobilis ZM4 = ATCC 31821]ACV75418.1 6-phosphogluconate dehydratase [Zymomonas mobilis subsp. mobilis NCIMB 11163]AEH62744.1 6-phosphogluconate dehydratase [Zymomonas mobilis subsp. mobilis ATCC 10988]AFN56773.1 6-phosphogluconate 